MTDPVDPMHLAARFLDLWQESLSAIAADTELLDAMNRSFAAAGFGAAAMAGFTGTYGGRPGFGGFPFAPGAASPGSAGSGSVDGASSSDHSAMEAQDARPSSGQKPSATARPAESPVQSGAQSRTTPAAAASDDGMESVAELAERVRLLEARLASLASVDAGHPRRPSNPGRGTGPGRSHRRSPS